MTSIAHLSDLCQKDEVEPILQFLRKKIRYTAADSEDIGEDAIEVNPPSIATHETEERVKNALSRIGPSSFSDSPYADLMVYQDNDGRTALHWAIAMRNFDLAKKLLCAPFQAVALTWDYGGCTTFLTACLVNSDLEFIEQLLRCAEVDFPRVQEWLRYEKGSEAVKEVDEGTKKDLLREDEDTDNLRLADLCPSTILQISIQQDSPNEEKKKEIDEKDKPLSESTEQQKQHSPSSFQGITSAIVNAADRLGNTPLMSAVGKGQINLVEFLLQHGADLGAQNCQGQTVLHRAVAKHSIELVELLIAKAVVLYGGKNTKEYRSFVNTSDRRGDTPLFYASMENDEEIGTYLLRHGANRDHRNKSNKLFYEV